MKKSFTEECGMKKVVVASLLAVAGMASVARNAVAQTPVTPSASAQPASGGVQMSPAEYAAYNNAIGQTAPPAKAAALEAYLTAYPQSAVKADTLQLLMATYSSIPDPAKTLDAADRLLQVDPNNLRALLLEVYFRRQQADQATDPAAKQTGYDSAAGFAQKGLAATKQKDMSDDDFTKLKAAAYPTFYSTIATAALNKKDDATAITDYKSELTSVPADSTKTPGPLLQDTYSLAQAYYQSTPPDYVNCTWYASRAAAFAPEPYKSQMMPLAKYCYKKYHGADDGYDAVLAAAQTSLDPPADFKIKPAPSPADIVAQVISSTPDLATLAISDKEFILTNGKPEDAAKVWDTIKGKSVQFPDATVVSVTDTTLLVAVSDDAVQSKTADFTFQLKAPLKTAPAPAAGDKVAVTGTYASFTPSPIMITMSDGAIVEKKAPAHHTTHH
jgi:hypothetical protein